jgi:hypothetical protein
MYKMFIIDKLEPLILNRMDHSKITAQLRRDEATVHVECPVSVRYMSEPGPVCSL